MIAGFFRFQAETMSLKAHVRWMIRRDMAEVLAIESECFEFAWDEDAFIRCLRQRNCIGMVAEHDDKVIGYMVYELRPTGIHLLNFAVHPCAQGKGVGRVMLEKLLDKMGQKRRSIACEVRDSNLDAQLFFRAMGFKAISILRGSYDDTDEDAYVFQYRHAVMEAVS